MNATMRYAPAANGAELSGEFFRELRKEMPIPTKRISEMAGRILTTIRRSLLPDEVSYWVGHLPGLLQLQFVREWRYREQAIHLDHLDMLVDLIYHDDQRSPHRLFRTEIDALEAIITIFSKLDRHLHLLAFPGLKAGLATELKQAIERSR